MSGGPSKQVVALVSGAGRSVRLKEALQLEQFLGVGLLPEGLAAQLRQSGGPLLGLLGPLAFLLGPLLGCLGPLAFLLGAVLDLQTFGRELLEGEERPAIGVTHH